jgi:hypothetical protein
VIEAPPPTLRHLALMSDAVGVFEHARLDEPRPASGYCTDDAGRLLALASKLIADPDAPVLARVALGFLERAHLGRGWFRLRQGVAGDWTNDPPSDDANGRALLGLGTAAACAPWPAVRERALALFDEAAGFRSEHPRAIAYATLGAVEVLKVAPAEPAAYRLVSDALGGLSRLETNDEWPWPAPRLTYANALLPNAELAAAMALGEQGVAAEAVSLLDWLVEEESVGDHFSFTPVGGRGPHDAKPGFDQQPIEALAMTEACARAFAHTGEREWAEAARRAGTWFLGNNDVGVAVFDAATGGGFDGLSADGPNRNEGAESTLAFVATMLALQELPAPL